MGRNDRPDDESLHSAACRQGCYRKAASFGVAYVLAGFAAFDRFPIHGIELTTLAQAVFGREPMASSLERILGVLMKWGYKPSIQGKIHTALAYTLLKNRSPRLEDISFGFLQTLNQKAQTKYS